MISPHTFKKEKKKTKYEKGIKKRKIRNNETMKQVIEREHIAHQA